MIQVVRAARADDVEVGRVPFGGELAPAMLLVHAPSEDALHVYQRPRDGGGLRYVMTMPERGGAVPVITGVAPDTWISGIGLDVLRVAAERLWQSRPGA